MYHKFVANSTKTSQKTILIDMDKSMNDVINLINKDMSKVIILNIRSENFSFRIDNTNILNGVKKRLNF